MPLLGMTFALVSQAAVLLNDIPVDNPFGLLNQSATVTVLGVVLFKLYNLYLEEKRLRVQQEKEEKERMSALLDKIIAALPKKKSEDINDMDNAV